MAKLLNTILILFTFNFLGVATVYGDTLKKSFDPSALQSALQESQDEQKQNHSSASIYRKQRVEEGDSGHAPVELHFTNHYQLESGLESDQTLEAFGTSEIVAQEDKVDRDMTSEIEEAGADLGEIENYEIESTPERDLAAENPVPITQYVIE